MEFLSGAEQRPNRKRRICRSVLLRAAGVMMVAIMMLLSGCMCWFPFERGSSGGGASPTQNVDRAQLSGLTASEDALVVGRYYEAILLTVEASGACDEVMLYQGSETVCFMNDNGQDGDALPGDGIYSAQINVSAGDQEEDLVFCAKAGAAASETLTIHVYDMPTAEEAAQTEELLFALQQIEQQYDTQAGLSQEEMDALFGQARALADEGKERGVVTEVIEQEDTLELWLNSGITVMFAPDAGEYLGGTRDIEMNLVTVEPFYGDFPSLGKNYADCVDETAYDIVEAFAGYRFANQFDYDQEEVTTAAIEAFGKNEVILWYGHGGFSSKYHSYLVTGEKFNAQAFHSDKEYYEKCAQGCFMMVGERIAITSKYIDRYCGNMENSMVFLTACESGKSDRLANAFLKKGATAVLGYDQTVHVIYGAQMMKGIMANMIRYDAGTNAYTTLQQAVKLAQQEFGETDRITSRVEAKLVIFGGDEAKNYRLWDETAEVAPSPTPSALPPTGGTPADAQQAYQAYRRFLQNYEWVSYCPSDLSEIPPEEYDRFWMGTYTLLDIDQNGIDELVIMAGQSTADTSHTFFTYQNGEVQCVGSLFCGSSSMYRSTTGRGAVLCEQHGGLGRDVYIDLIGNKISVVRTEEYNYEAPGYVDAKSGAWELVPSKNVSDLSSFS